MATGIKVINDSGTIQIDDSYPTLVVRAQGSVTIPAAGFIRVRDLSIQGRLALRATNVVSYLTLLSTIDPYPPGYYVYGAPGTNVQWYLFAVNPGPAGNVGLVIRNAAGALMFDSGAKNMRVVDIRSGPAQANWGGTVNYDGGRDYAVLPMVAGFNSSMTHTRIGGGDPNQYFQNDQQQLAGGSVNGSSVNFAMTPAATMSYGPYTATVLPANYSGSSGNAALAVIDVTSY